MSANLYKDDDMISTPVSVSIIIPVFNVELYIKDCLKSVEAQDYSGPIECIIVDDCGKDKSMEIVQNFLNNYIGQINFKIIHHKENLGLSAARNTGIDIANGEYIYFLDSDDEITPDCIKFLVNKLKDKDYDVVIGDFTCIGNKHYRGLGINAKDIVTKDDCFRSFLDGDLYEMAWNKLVSRNFIKRNNIYFEEGLLHEDVLWSFFLFYMASTVAIVKKITYKYRIRNNSIANSLTEKNIQHLLFILNKKHDFIISENLFNRVPKLKYHIVLKMIQLITLSLSINLKNNYIIKIRNNRKLKNYLYLGMTMKQIIKTIAVWFPYPIIKYLFNRKIIF